MVEIYMSLGDGGRKKREWKRGGAKEKKEITIYFWSSLTSGTSMSRGTFSSLLTVLGPKLFWGEEGGTIAFALGTVHGATYFYKKRIWCVKWTTKEERTVERREKKVGGIWQEFSHVAQWIMFVKTKSKCRRYSKILPLCCSVSVMFILMGDLDWEGMRERIISTAFSASSGSISSCTCTRICDPTKDQPLLCSQF